MTELEQLEIQLAAQKEAEKELAAERAETARKIAELKARVPVKVSIDLIGATLTIKVDRYDHGLVSLLKSFPGWSWDGSKNNYPVESYHQIEKELKELGDKVILSYNGDAYSRINQWLTKPDYDVRLDQRNEFVIELGPKQATGEIVYGLKGLRGTSGKFKSYRLGAQEGIKLGEFLIKRKELNPSVKIYVSAEAQELIDKQTEDSNKLAKIAAQEKSTLEFPDFNGQTLRDFQGVGVEYALAAKKFIIGDATGLGKSPQSIAHHIMVQRQSPDKVTRSCWIVPAQLLMNWIVQIEKFTGQTPRVFEGTIPDQHDYSDFLVKQVPLVLMSYETINRPIPVKSNKPDKDGNAVMEDFFPWINLINIAAFTNIYLDEGHYIKNKDSNRSKACRELRAENIGILTATPVMNRPGELWPMLNLLKPDEFQNYEGFLNTYSDGGNGVINVPQLREVLKNVMIRRKKKDVQKELAPINRIEEYVELSAKAKKVYNKALQDVYESMLTGHTSDITNILVKIMRLKQITSIAKYEHAMGLADRLIDAHGDEPNGKVIIFSQFIPSVKKLAYEMEAPYAVGLPEMSVSERQKIVERFQVDNRKVIVCSSAAMQTGFDMTAAGYTIFLDLMWTPAAHEQCEGRAYGRLNDSHPIDSYYILGRKTIDQSIWGLLHEKMLTIEASVDGQDDSKDTSVVKALIYEMRTMGFTPLI